MRIRRITLSKSGFNGETAYRVGSHLVASADAIIDRNEDAYGVSGLACDCNDGSYGNYCEHLAAVAEYMARQVERKLAAENRAAYRARRRFAAASVNVEKEVMAIVESVSFDTAQFENDAPRKTTTQKSASTRLHDANRALSVEQVSNRINGYDSRLWRRAIVVGEWVWIPMPDRGSRQAANYLYALGFSWNAQRLCWQHPCGNQKSSYDKRGDPRNRYAAHALAR
jgi:hypothetical protein